jgi:hypothetical protein
MTDISKLAFGFASAFVLPAIGYVIGATWNKIVGGVQPQVDKAWASFCMLSPILILAMMAGSHVDAMRAVWLEAPFIASIGYLFTAIVIPAALIYGTIRLWHSRGSNHRR